MSNRSLDCSEAYDLGEGPEGLGYRGNALRVRSLEPLDAHALARGESKPSKVIEFVRDEGRVPYDLVGTTWATVVLVSARFCDLLSRHRFVGWTTFPVSVRLEDGSELDGYRGFAVTGRCGPLDDSLSETVIMPPPVPTGEAMPGLRGICFQPESWDGSDIFTAEDLTGIFVVGAVKDALEDAGITNVAFKRLSEIERMWRADGSLVGD